MSQVSLVHEAEFLFMWLRFPMSEYSSYIINIIIIINYKSLYVEIQRMWNLKCTIVPVVIGATGIVTRSLRKIWKLYQENTR